MINNTPICKYLVINQFANELTLKRDRGGIFTTFSTNLCYTSLYLILPFAYFLSTLYPLQCIKTDRRGQHSKNNITRFFQIQITTILALLWNKWLFSNLEVGLLLSVESSIFDAILAQQNITVAQNKEMHWLDLWNFFATTRCYKLH